MLDRRAFSLSAAALLAGCASSPPTRPEATGPWRQLNTVPYNGKQDDICFVSPDVGWYGNGEGKLYRTQDGGEVWESVWEQPGTFIRALGFIDAQHGFLGNVGMGAYPNVSDARPLYRTRDGGVTWTPVEAENIGIVAGICGIDVLPQQRIYQGELRTSAIVHAAGRVGGPATMLRSFDGGETWRVLDLRQYAGMILDVKFFDAETGLVCAASSSNVAEANALILRTDDGGATWTEAYRSPRLFENCWKMSFPTRRVGYATVQNYAQGTADRVVIKTADGGASWRELPLVSDPRVREFGVGFVDENWGWVGSTTTGFETLDGGASWAPIEMGRAVNKIRIVRSPDAVRAYAIGTNVFRRDFA
jgi:photosystem II stability/assembly factor-like uncharacterized protein